MKVVFTAHFRADLSLQTRRLVGEGRSEWAARLIDEVDLSRRLLARSPLAGLVELERRRRQIRRLVLPHLPFVVWYPVVRRRVVVQRLFHVRQRRQR
jgi:plasmid stabilization system protein ParE